MIGSVGVGVGVGVGVTGTADADLTTVGPALVAALWVIGFLVTLCVWSGWFGSVRPARRLRAHLEQVRPGRILVPVRAWVLPGEYDWRGSLTRSRLVGFLVITPGALECWDLEHGRPRRVLCQPWSRVAALDAFTTSIMLSDYPGVAVTDIAPEQRFEALLCREGAIRRGLGEDEFRSIHLQLAAMVRTAPSDRPSSSV